MLAHREVYFALHPNADRTLAVCHQCDNPICCNPAHLWLGRQQDNIRDMDNKGRRKLPPVRRGIDASKTKLTEAIVQQIVVSPLSNAELAEKYSVTASAIYNVRHGKSWRHVTGLKRDA